MGHDARRHGARGQVYAAGAEPEGAERKSAKQALGRTYWQGAFVMSSFLNMHLNEFGIHGFGAVV
jgi:hypothetical protein